MIIRGLQFGELRQRVGDVDLKSVADGFGAGTILEKLGCATGLCDVIEQAPVRNEDTQK